MTFPNTLEFVCSLHFEHFMHFFHFEHFVQSDHSEHSHHFDFDFDTDNMAQHPPLERTLSERVAPDFTYDSLRIKYPNEEVPYVCCQSFMALQVKTHTST